MCNSGLIAYGKRAITDTQSEPSQYQEHFSPAYCKCCNNLHICISISIVSRQKGQETNKFKNYKVQKGGIA